jgi:hypothetical protein
MGIKRRKWLYAYFGNTDLAKHQNIPARQAERFLFISFRPYYYHALCLVSEKQHGEIHCLGSKRPSSCPLAG